jgi:hypothetical protein
MPSNQTTDTKCSHDPLDHWKLKRFMFFVQSQHQHSQNNDLDSYSEHGIPDKGSKVKDDSSESGEDKSGSGSENNSKSKIFSVTQPILYIYIYVCELVYY